MKMVIWSGFLKYRDLVKFFPNHLVACSMSSPFFRCLQILVVFVIYYITIFMSIEISMISDSRFGCIEIVGIGSLEPQNFAVRYDQSQNITIKLFPRQNSLLSVTRSRIFIPASAPFSLSLLSWRALLPLVCFSHCIHDATLLSGSLGNFYP